MHKLIICSLQSTHFKYNISKLKIKKMEKHIMQTHNQMRAAAAILISDKRDIRENYHG